MTSDRQAPDRHTSDTQRLAVADESWASGSRRDLGPSGAVGVEGDVDRHFLLMFGSAVMLGMLDGLAAAVEGANNSATPTARELMVARTSMNMSQVVAGILARYGNVVPTITVEAGSKMKVLFAEDVRMSPYMRSRELSWVKLGGGR